MDTLGQAGDYGGDDAERLKDMASEAPVIRFVNQLAGPSRRGHRISISSPSRTSCACAIESTGSYRRSTRRPGRLTAAIISRVKIMSKLNIAERRLPQDGRVKLARGKEVDFRVSTVPTMHGESVVMRILDRGGAVFDFSVLG